MQPQNYSGKVTPVGNSKGIRFDAALFKAHPEFAGEVSATVVGEGHMLVSVKSVDQPQDTDEHQDPVLLAFLGFIERDMLTHPENIEPLDEVQMQRIASLVDGVETD